MADTTEYSRGTSFTDAQAADPTSPLSGPGVDGEFDNVKLAIDSTQESLDLIQRDDGELANQSVGYDQLATGLLTGIQPVTSWVTATNYDVYDSVFYDDGATLKLYRCLVSHVAGVFADDLADGDWLFVADYTPPAVVGVVGEAQGGTGETTFAAARDSMGLGDVINSLVPVLTGGTSTAFTLVSAEPISAYAVNQVFSARFHTACGASPTINRDGVGAVAMKYHASGGSKVALPSGGIQAHVTAEMYYDGTDVVVISGLSLSSGSTPGLLKILDDETMATMTTSWPSSERAVALYVRNIAHPVGSLYFSVTDADPATTLGFGTWVAYAAGRAVVGVGTDAVAPTYATAWTAGQTKGAEKHVLTETEMPAHTHDIEYSNRTRSAGTTETSDLEASASTDQTESTGGDGAHNNLQPSIGVYIWQRTA